MFQIEKLVHNTVSPTFCKNLLKHPRACVSSIIEIADLTIHSPMYKSKVDTKVTLLTHIYMHMHIMYNTNYIGKDFSTQNKKK